MDVSFGFKAHSGWAALVSVGRAGGGYAVAERRRVELVEETWAKAPYHAAEELEAGRARRLVERAVAAAHRGAAREMRAALAREGERGNQVRACGVLVGSPMPPWSVDEIRAVHPRMHQAEGALFRDALLRAAEACGIRVVPIPEKQLVARAERALGMPAGRLLKLAASLGKALGPPWGRDQKDAALAAMVAQDLSTDVYRSR
ncbi:MAG: hypothetical protein AB7O37_19025 [Vicinamibacteria bacterium]